MGAPITEYDLENYGVKIKDVKKINLCITIFCLFLSSFITISIYYIKAND